MTRPNPRPFASAISLALLALAATRGDAASLGPQPGRAAPPFLLERASGDELTLRSFAGRPLVMNVFASWCPPCRLELPGIIKAARATQGRVAWVGVDEQEAREMGDAFARSMHVPYPVVYDHGQFAATYGATALPVTVFIDARGRIGSIHHGAMTASDLDRGLASIHASRATPAQT